MRNGPVLSAVARHAGETISEIILAMTGKIPLSTLSDVIYPYPHPGRGDPETGRHLQPIPPHAAGKERIFRLVRPVAVDLTPR